jgi:hypothetical protein
MNIDKVVEAIKTIDRLLSLGDSIYSVREHYAEAHPGMISWDTPEVREYGDALDILIKEGVIDG